MFALRVCVENVRLGANGVERLIPLPRRASRGLSSRSMRLCLSGRKSVDGEVTAGRGG